MEGDCDKSLTFEDGPQHTWVYCSYECNSDPDCLANGYINDDGWEIICLMDECTSDCYLNYTSSGIAHWHCALALRMLTSPCFSNYEHQSSKDPT